MNALMRQFIINFLYIIRFYFLIDIFLINISSIITILIFRILFIAKLENFIFVSRNLVNT